MKKSILIIGIILTIISCKTQPNKDANDIRSILINNEYSSYFKMPNSYKKVLDTNKLLINGKFRVLLNTKLYTLTKIKVKNEYQNTFKKCSIIEKNDKIILENLTVNNKIHLQKVTEKTIKKFRGNFNVYISFSNILFNEKMDKAIVLVNVTYSSLNNSSDIYFLQKVNGVWCIENHQNQSFS